MTHYERRSQARRSRSPRRPQDQELRQRSPLLPSREHHHATSRKHNTSRTSVVMTLPLNAMPISKHDFEVYKPMFGLYLDIQKHLVLDELESDEARGRWKSFVGKWNRGELAEGWYDPVTLQKAQVSSLETAGTNEKAERRRDSPVYEDREKEDNDSSDEEFGPALPGTVGQSHRTDKRTGPAIPNLQDLELRRELDQEDSRSRLEDLRYDRRMDRKRQKEALDDLAPRAEAGSKDRMLEKKREKADANRTFASARSDAKEVEDVPDADLLGDENGGVEGFKKQKRELERKKNERELRKEEILRSRREEREERIREYKKKEAETMSGLVALAKQKFG